MAAKKTKINFKNLKSGDILVFKMNNGRHGYSVIVSKINEGHVAEIYKFTSDSIIDNFEPLTEAYYPPLILDTYSLITRKSEGEWDFIGHKADYEISPQVRQTKFVWGILGKRRTTDIFDQNESISDEESLKLPIAYPRGDLDVQKYLKEQGVN